MSDKTPNPSKLEVMKMVVQLLRDKYAQSKLGQQNFGPEDSTMASTINHPIDAAQKAGQWLQGNIDTAGGQPQYQDEASMYGYAPSGEEQAQAGINLAGTAQMGGMPGAPPSSGGTVGTMTYPVIPEGPITAPRSYKPVGRGPQGALEGTLTRVEQNKLKQALQMRSPMRGFKL